MLGRLGVLVAVFPAADSNTLTGHTLLAHRISTSFTVGAGMLAAALILVAMLSVARRAPAPALA